MLRVFAFHECYVLSRDHMGWSLAWNSAPGTSWLALLALYMPLYLQEACMCIHARRLVSEYFQGWVWGFFGNIFRFQSERRKLLYWSLLGIQNRTKQNDNKKAAGSSALRLTQEPNSKGILIRKLCSPSPRDNEKCFAFNHVVVGHHNKHTSLVNIILTDLSFG